MSQRMRAIAILTLICFCWTILMPALLSGQETTGLDNARRLYKEGRIDKAKEALDTLITQWSGKPALRQALADAYFLRAKIFLDVLENAKFEADLQQLFALAPDFAISGDDPELKTIAERIRLEVAQKRLETIKQAQAVLQQEQERVRLEAAQKIEDARKAEAQKKLAEDQKIADVKRIEQERLRLEAEQKAEAKRKLDEVNKAEALKKATENQTTKLVEKEGQPGLKNKKSFPWLLVVLGGAAVVLLVVLLAGGKSSSTPTPPVATTGSIQVNSTPTGAKIYLDGADTGKTTNSLLTNVSVGSHAIKLTLAGYNDYTATCTVAAGQTATINASVAIIEATYINGVLTVKGVRYDMVAIPGGSFQMGSVSAESYSDEKPVHTVTISAFYMGKTEVTQGLWKAVMGNNPSGSTIGDAYPVEKVSWTDCQAFFTKLNQMLGGSNFKMPTEAQWEYACRAGTSGDRYGSIDAIAWYVSNSGGATHPVGQKQANAWGLYDMLGNVWEWCSDWYDAEYYHVSPTNNPTGPASGSYRVRRGGSCYYSARNVRSPYRFSDYPSFANPDVGFRLSRD